MLAPEHFYWVNMTILQMQTWGTVRTKAWDLQTHHAYSIFPVTGIWKEPARTAIQLERLCKAAGSPKQTQNLDATRLLFLLIREHLKSRKHEGFFPWTSFKEMYLPFKPSICFFRSSKKYSTVGTKGPQSNTMRCSVSASSNVNSLMILCSH